MLILVNRISENLSGKGNYDGNQHVSYYHNGFYFFKENFPTLGLSFANAFNEKSLKFARLVKDK